MAHVLITRMPSTGEITNVADTDRPDLWADNPHIQIMTKAEYDVLPKCECCGEWKALRRCGVCSGIVRMEVAQ